MDLLILNSSDRRAPRKFLKEWVQGIQKEIKGLKGQGLVLQFLSAPEMKRLNLKYRGKARPTDVLSFAGMEPGSLGELALCPDVIEKNARDHGLLYAQELGYVVLHGILHLLGYEHEASEAKAQVMFRLQDRIFAKLMDKRWPPKGKR